MKKKVKKGKKMQVSRLIITELKSDSELSDSDLESGKIWF